MSAPRLVDAKMVTCNRCGDPQVAWLKSKRTGRFYLATAYIARGREVAAPTQFHRCDTVLAARAEEQARIAAIEAKAEARAKDDATIAALRLKAQAEGNTATLALLDELEGL